MEIKPLGNYVHVQAATAKEQTTGGGIILPQNVQSQCTEAIVKGCGSEVKIVKVGDRVLVNDPVAIGFTIHGASHGLVREDGILAVIEGIVE